CSTSIERSAAPLARGRRAAGQAGQQPPAVRLKPASALGLTRPNQSRSAPRRQARLRNPLAAQALDLLVPVTRFLPDFGGVLADRRRLAVEAGAAVSQPEPGADEAHGAIARVDGLQHVAVLELRMADDLVDLPDRAAGYVGGGEPRLPCARIVDHQH